MFLDGEDGPAAYRATGQSEFYFSAFEGQSDYVGMRASLDTLFFSVSLVCQRTPGLDRQTQADKTVKRPKVLHCNAAYLGPMRLAQRT